MKRDLEELEEVYLKTYAFDEAVTERIKNVWERSSCPVYFPMEINVIRQKVFGSWLAVFACAGMILHDSRNDAFGVGVFSIGLWGIALWGIFTLPMIDWQWREEMGLQLSPEGLQIWRESILLKWKIYSAIRNIIIGIVAYHLSDSILYQIWGVYTLVYITAFHNMSKATARSLLGENDHKIPWLRPYCFRKHYGKCIGVSSNPTRSTWWLVGFFIMRNLDF